MHDRKNVGPSKRVQSSPGTAWAEPEPSSRSVENPSSHPSGLGDRSPLPSGSNLAAPLANPVSQRPQFFNFDAQAVRVVGTPEAPWFIAKDVCAVLEIAN